MPGGLGVLLVLVLAAVLEIGGDAAIRHGLARSGLPALLGGSVLLVAYGFLVNTNRSLDFGRLMGTYIAVFFLVSQTIAWLLFRQRPSTALVIGGTLIILGGLVIQAGR